MTRDMVALKRQIEEVAFSGPSTMPTASGDGGGSTRQTPPGRMPLFKGVVEAERQPDFARGDWLIDDFGTKIPRLTPMIAHDVYARWVEYRILEPLVDRDPDTLDYIPHLAESWTTKDNSEAWEAYVKPLRAKGMTDEQIGKHVKDTPDAPSSAEFTFRLRRNVTFSDGRPLTADDVVFTLEWLMNPEINAAHLRAYFENFRWAKANGSHEVTVAITRPYFASFENIGGIGILSKAFYSRFKPQEFNERTGLMIGTGPYRLIDPEGWKPGMPIELLRNERYWGVPPTFNKIIFRETTEDAPMMTSFLNGDLDLFTCQPDQYVAMMADERVKKVAKNYQYPSPFRGYTYIGWNQRRKGEGGKEEPTAFADRRVRLAMTHLIDRERIIRDIYHGLGAVASGPFFPKGPQANPAVKPWPFDPAKGKALLADAGYADRDGDGTIEGPDGRPFRFKLAYPSGLEMYNRMGLFLKDGFKVAGITMDPDPTEWSVLTDRLKKGQFEACTLGWGGVLESDPYQIFHSAQIKDQGDNRTAYSNPKLDALIDKARVTFDDPARMKIWHEVHQILHEDQPYTFMVNRPELQFVVNRIANVKTTKLGLNYERMMTNPNPWYVPQNLQRYTKD
jgi:peptide/nickel transport system substrate-binding protein